MKDKGRPLTQGEFVILVRDYVNASEAAENYGTWSCYAKRNRLYDLIKRELPGQLKKINSSRLSVEPPL